MNTNIPLITICLDLGDKKHFICVLNQEGQVVEQRSITNHKESLRRLSFKYPGARIALEVGSHSPWISRFLKSLKHEVLVANPRKMRAIYASTRKCDEHDALMLARIARMDPQLLSPIEHSDEEAQRDLLQIKLRNNLVRQRVDIISSVRFTLKSLGVVLTLPNTACFAKRARVLLIAQDASLLAMIEPSLQVLYLLTQKIRELDFQIETLASQKHPVTNRLRQIAGVGPITLRRLLVGAAQYIMGPFGPDCDLRRRGA